MTATVTSLSPSNPREAVMRAVAWVRRLTVTVVTRADYHGVRCVSGEAPDRWVRARKYGPVSPLGALLLWEQPAACDDAEAAAAVALDVDPAWVAGFLAGLERREPDRRWQTAPTFRLALAGLEDGTKVRAALLGPKAVR